MNRPAVAILGLLLSGSAWSEVVETGANSLTVESSVSVAAAPDAAFVALTGGIPRWWDPAHTWSGDATNLSLDLRAGGCFCEQLPDSGGSVRHGQVIFVQPGKMLRLDAALGPFQEMAVKGVLTFRLAADGNGTRVTLNYRVYGAITMDPAKLAPMVDAMLAGQLQRYRTFVAGNPAK